MTTYNCPSLTCDLKNINIPSGGGPTATSTCPRCEVSYLSDTWRSNPYHKTPDQARWTQVPQKADEPRMFVCNSCEARRPWNNLGHLCFESPVNDPANKPTSQAEAACDELTRQEKPPLGVMPKDIWREQRMRELARAIHSYLMFAPLLDNHVTINEWATELKALSDVYTRTGKS